MTLPLTPEMLRATYDLLATTPPYNRWNLPDSEDVRFRVVKDPRHFGWHTFDFESQRHEIAVSSALVGHIDTLVETMGHEIIHVHERQSGACKPGVEHSAAFKKWSEQACRRHGWDPKGF